MVSKIGRVSPLLLFWIVAPCLAAPDIEEVLREVSVKMKIAQGRYGCSGTVVFDEKYRQHYVMTAQHCFQDGDWELDSAEVFIGLRETRCAVKRPFISQWRGTDVSMFFLNCPSQVNWAKFPKIKLAEDSLTYKTEGLWASGFPRGRQNRYTRPQACRLFGTNLGHQVTSNCWLEFVPNAQNGDYENIQGASGGGLFTLQNGEIRLLGVLSQWFSPDPDRSSSQYTLYSLVVL